MLRTRVTIALGLLSLPAPALAQLAFVPRESLARATPIAFDSHRQRGVMFGGRRGGEVSGQTWEWDGEAWGERLTARAPSPRADHTLAYDAARRRVVLFGGNDGRTSLNDTWEWDGATWTQRALLHAPPASNWHAMTYDSVRSRVVWFAHVFQVQTAMTWEWDGNTWLLRATGGPPPTVAPTLTFDAARGRSVLIGGSEVWEWDGTQWSGPTRFPGTGSYSAATTYDAARRRLVWFGVATNAPRAELWEYDGVQWAQRQSASGPRARSGPGLTYDAARRRVLLFGGAAETFQPGDTWEWDGNAWAARDDSDAPRAHFGHVFAQHVASGRCLAFGTLGGTWLWDARWTRAAQGSSPPERYGAALAYDSARARLVLFGGTAETGLLNDTHEWDGLVWRAHTPVVSPPPQSAHAMTYDAARQRTVLFGSGAETWEWDGSVWVRTPAATAPPARYGHALAYDTVRRRTVLFGGEVNGQAIDDTWEWDGATWTRATPTRQPPPRYAPAMAFDAARRQVVLFGGAQPLGRYDELSLDDAWGFDGSTWTQLQFGTTPLGRSGSAMTFDAARGHLLLDGGRRGVSPLDRRAFAGPIALTPHPVAQVASVGSGCGASGAPRLLTFNLPRVGTPSFAIDLETAPPSAPCALALATRAAATALPGGCVLRVDPASLLASSVAMSSPLGTMRWRLPLHGNSLRGVTLHAQAFALDAGGSLLGMAMSQGLEVRPGD